MGKRVLMAAAVVLAAASLALWVAERAGEAAGAFVQQGKLEASDGAAQDSLGFSVAVSGDTAVVGAPADANGSNTRQGAAYVYVRNGSTWTQQQKLTASDGIANDEFGYAVAIVGDTIFVGRHFTQVGNNARTRGAVYVFTRAGSTWTQAPTPLTPSDAADGDLFGSSLAVDGDTLVVGALQKNNGATFFQGAAYVFTGAGASWTQQGKLLANDGGFANFFGISVAVSGDTAVVGAPGQAGVSADQGRGAAYVFTRAGASWAQQQKLLASDGAAGDAFGFSVGVSGDTAVVGSRLDSVNGVGGQGSAYVFARSGAVWTEQQHLFGVETVQRNDTFGGSVAIKGDTIAVGAPAHEIVPSIANHGAVYVFTRAGTVWTRQQKLIHSDPAPDALGTSVAFDGSSVVAGAPSKNSARGAAYVFALDPDAGPKLTASDGTDSDRLGSSVAVEGDTAIVGAPFENNTGPGRGAAYVFTRAGGVWTQQAKLVAPDASSNDNFGVSVAISGDTVVVGAEQGDKGTNTNEGSAYVFTRNGSAWTFQQELTADDGAGGDRFGWSVDVEGDTVAVGAVTDNLDPDGLPEGTVHVFTRSGSAWTLQQKINSPNLEGLPRFGESVSLSGATIVVGASSDNGNVVDGGARGAAYVYTRAGSAWSLQQRLSAGNNEFDEFGRSVSVSGDTVAVGSPIHDHGPGSSAGSNQGAVYVYTRAGSAWSLQQKLVASDAVLGEQLGYSVALEGDRLVAGARLDDFTNPSRLSQGSAYLFQRSGAAWTESQKFSAFDGAAFDQFGWAVALSGNTALAGAPFKDIEGKPDQGAAYVFELAGLAPTPTPAPTPTGSVQFTTSTVQVDESAGGGGSVVTHGAAEWWRAANASAAGGAAGLTVTRTDATHPASVDYATQDGTANSRSDYSAVFGTLRFAAGETTKTIVVQVTDDRFQESAETFSVVLSNPSGVSLGTPSAATVEVTSDDTTTGENPVADATFDVDFFVRQHYADFLGREADASGLAFWKDEIAQCETLPEAERQGCREVKRVNVSAAFFLSIEFQETGYFVYLLHRAAFDAGEHLAFSRFLADAGEVRQGVVVEQGEWRRQLEENKAAFALAFVRRPEFTSAFPSTLTPAEFVDAVNANTGGSLSQSERDARVAELAADDTDAGRAAALLKVLEDPDFRQRETNRAFVLMQYFGYLRRAPNEPPDSNFDGFNFWLSKLEEFNGNFVEAEMVKAFITSDEYRQRFGP